MNKIYLDNNATTCVDPEVLDAMMPYLRDWYYNPSSMYDIAKIPSQAMENARKIIADSLGASNPKEILFTSCATESNSTAILGALRANPTKKHIVTSKVEHPAVLELCKDLERQGCTVDYIGVDENGELDMKAFVRALQPNQTLIVSMMHANNETGVIFPVEKLSALVKQLDPSILFHTDATQSVGKLPIDLSTTYKNVDLLSFSGHKLHAPKGIGALFIRSQTPVRPFLIGGHQEGNRRAGTQNIPYIVALGKAVELAVKHMSDEERIRNLRNELELALLDIPHTVINGRKAPRLANTTNVAFHFVEGEGILYQLDLHDICASSGSACTSGSLDPSHVLQAMKVPFTAVHGSIRFSLSRFNTRDDILKVIEVMPGIIARLRKISPYWDNARNAPSERKLMVEL